MPTVVVILAACRAVIFASIVDDPSDCPEEFPTEEAQGAERRRLHNIISEFVVWENTDPRKPEARAVMEKARREIARSVARSYDEPAPNLDDPTAILRYLNDKALPIYDPFCGRGSIPLEAQRLGMRAIGSDLNPIAVLIAKALIEIPPKFADLPPVNPEADHMGMTVGNGRKAQKLPWQGASGLANDIRYYGQWMRERALNLIGNLYPKATLPNGEKATVIAWLWTHTVPCANPACGIPMPLMHTFQLSTKSGNQHWTKPEINRDTNTVSFKVQNHNGGVPTTKTVGDNSATCVACNSSVPLDYVREQARAGNMKEQMTGIVCEGNRRRIFQSPTPEHVAAALEATSKWKPIGSVADRPLGISIQGYGLNEWHEVFTERQLLTHTTFSDLLREVRTTIVNDGADDEYSDAVITYLSLGIGKNVDSGCRFAKWQNTGDKVAGVFGMQTISMVWDFAEVNPFSHSTQNWMAQIEWIAKVVERTVTNVNRGTVYQSDASTTPHVENGPVIVTDPPYYASVGYADLSDFFYVWLRPLLRETYPDLFASIATPKDEEVIASPRHEDPSQRFEDLLGRTLTRIREHSSPEFPSSIFYAYKQQEENREGRTSTGWETMLSGLVNAGFQIVGTWPMRTERPGRSRAVGSNALASSVILVCRPRSEEAPTATRRQFLDSLESELPRALEHLTREGHIAPVDTAQAAIGPGMQIYSRYNRVETIAGEQVTVREALAAINRVIAEYDEQTQGDLDGESRFCLSWLRQNEYNESSYGEAQDLARAMNVSVEELRDSHRLLNASTGSVSLLPEDEYGPDRRAGLQEISAWEGCFRMVYHLDPTRENGGGIGEATGVARAMGSNAESVERLARILYNHYDQRDDSHRAVLFNNLVTEWTNIIAKTQDPDQGRLV